MGVYVSYLDDEDLLRCIGDLFNVYKTTLKSFDLAKFYDNRIDPFKMQFDVAFLYNQNTHEWINAEMRRKIDKTVNNAIGEFHQKLIGCLPGLMSANLSDYDVKSKNDNTLFAEIKNKNNTMNSRSRDSVFEALSGLARSYREAKCYLVEIVTDKSILKIWEYSSHGQTKKHDRVYIASVDQFYSMIVGCPNAFKELCDNIPPAIADYLRTQKILSNNLDADGVIQALDARAREQNTEGILNLVFSDMFAPYLGFDTALLNRED